MKTLLLITLMVAGCGHSNIDPFIQPYVDSFVAAGNLTITVPMTIQFGDLSGQAEEGLCQTGLGEDVITIDSASWAIYDEAGKTLIVWHELGHCVLGRVHNTNGGPNDPTSIMTPDTEDAHNGFSANPQPFIHELFTATP